MTRGWLLVAAQGLMFGLVAVTAFLPGPTLFVSLFLGLALVVAGAVVVLVTRASLGRSLTPLPQPNGAGMVSGGLYRWVRHPMYAGLVVICLGVAVGTGGLWCYVAVVLLAAFFAFKAREEERFLVGAYEGYAAYGAQVGRFVPGVGRLRKLSTD